MSKSHRPEVPRLSSHFTGHIITDAFDSFNQTVIPSCGVEIIPRRKNNTIDDNDNDFSIKSGKSYKSNRNFTLLSSKSVTSKLHNTDKTDNDDDSVNSRDTPTVSKYKDLLNERDEKIKTDRQNRGMIIYVCMYLYVELYIFMY